MVRRASLFLFAVVAAAGVAHAADSAKPGDDPKKLVCKRQTVTGSLAQATHVCHTREEWQLLGEQNRAEGQRMQDQSFRQGGRGN